MYVPRRSPPMLGVICVLACVECCVAQEQRKVAGGDDEAETDPQSSDPRLIALTKRYQARLRELRQQYVTDIESLGIAGTPAYLEYVDERGARLAYQGSWGGIANHWISINARDIEETESWHPFLESPPLSPRDALVIADTTIREWYKDVTTTKFEMKRLSLVPLAPDDGKWHWEADYKVSIGSRSDDLTIAIRMDGKTLTELKSAISAK